MIHAPQYYSFERQLTLAILDPLLSRNINGRGPLSEISQVPQCDRSVNQNISGKWKLEHANNNELAGLLQCPVRLARKPRR